MFDLLVTILKSELQKITSSVALISTAIMSILFYFVFYPQPYVNEAVHNIPIAIIDQDNTVSSRKFIQQVNSVEGLQVIEYLPDTESAKAKVEKRNVFGYLTIPFQFEKNILANHQSPVTFHIDASYMLIYSTAAKGMASAIRNFNTEIATKRQVNMGIDYAVAKNGGGPFKIQFISLFNPEGGYATYLIPPAFLIILAQTLLVAILISIISTSNATLVNKLVYKSENLFKLSLIMIIGKIIPYSCLYFCHFIIYTIFAPYWLNLPRLGDISLLLYFSLPFILATILMGISLSAVIKKFEAIFLIVVPITMVLFFLSGISWPKEMIPAGLNFFGSFFPVVTGIVGLTKINNMGANFIEVAAEINWLWFLVSFYLILAIMVTYSHVNRIKKILTRQK